MIRDFYFSWQGRRWSGYFNAIDRQTVIAHFEDDQIREAIGKTVVYSKSEKGAVTCSAKMGAAQHHESIYDSIQKGVQCHLGKTLGLYLN